jgi:hypothetical protein
MPGGRPRKYASSDAYKHAHKEQMRSRYSKKQRQDAGSIAFIPYEPALEGTQVTATRPELNLRVSQEIGVLLEPATREGPSCQDIFDTIEQPSDTGSVDDDVNFEGQLEVAQSNAETQGAKEQDEQAAYDAAVLRRISQETCTSAEATVVNGRIVNPQAMSCTSPTVGTGNARRQASIVSESSTRRRIPQKSFPVQKNTLLSWVQAAPQRAAMNSHQQGAAELLQSAPVHPTSAPGTRSDDTTYDHNEHCGQESVGAETRGSPCRQRATTSDSTPRAQDARPPSIDSASGARNKGTAFRLAKQLRTFQGCSYEQHADAQRTHHLHHEREDVHPSCSSLQQITQLVRGIGEGRTPLPDVLRNEKMMAPNDLPANLDLRAVFEGIDQSAGSVLPASLCLDRHHGSSPKERRAETSFDIDSLCCFPSSLGIARKGIAWFPRCHAFLNFTADVHFSLPVKAYNASGDLTIHNVPLHKIPHSCFGTLEGMDGVFIYVFFPCLRLESQYIDSTILSGQDQELWFDAVLMPTIKEVVKSSNVLQYYPASASVARLDSTALSSESFAKKQSAREQLLHYPIQPEYLDLLWTRICERTVENPGFEKFSNAQLFVHAKNTKVQYMDQSLSSTYVRWQKCWNDVADPQFYSRSATFVDLGKQITSEDSALPYDAVPNDHEAETYLWRRCCLAAYAERRVLTRADGQRARGSPRVATYPWATMRDTVGQTLFAPPCSQENTDGLVYSQFYGLVKTPFDTAKQYVFWHDALENLALDPGYIRSLWQAGGRVTFNASTCEHAYLHSKKRAHANLVDNQWRSYGIREEHRVSLAMMDEISELWRDWDLYDDCIDDTAGPAPYYTVPTKDLLSFLYAQINKYCFLFEHTRAHTARSYSLPETMMMVVALRALRFCYGSSLLQKELLLFKDRWEVTRGASLQVREGLGMRASMERSGLGWFLSKFNWSTRRIAPPHSDNMLVGTVLLHAEYRRKWKAVKDLRDVFVRFSQAEAWYERYDMSQKQALQQKWLEYLHVLNMEQFDADLWKSLLATDKRGQVLNPVVVEQMANGGMIRFCHRGMRNVFLSDGIVSPPQYVRGNRSGDLHTADVLKFIFGRDDRPREGWAHKPYRLILEKSYQLVERRLGLLQAQQWWDEFLRLVQLTHWTLPHATNRALIENSKQNRNKGLTGRPMWFSSVYHESPKQRFEPDPAAYPTTLHRALHRAFRQIGGRGDVREYSWGTRELIQAVSAQGLKLYSPDATDSFWKSGRASLGSKGHKAVWERGLTPRLRMYEDIREKSMDELEDFMARLAAEHACVDVDVQDMPAPQDVARRRRPLRSIADIFGSVRASTESASAYQPSSN